VKRNVRNKHPTIIKGVTIYEDTDTKSTPKKRKVVDAINNASVGEKLLPRIQKILNRDSANSPSILGYLNWSGHKIGQRNIWSVRNGSGTIIDAINRIAPLWRVVNEANIL
jgi:hypothetical protein